MVASALQCAFMVCFSLHWPETYAGHLESNILSDVSNNEPAAAMIGYPTYVMLALDA